MSAVVLLSVYLLGSIPFSLVVSYLWAGIDLRRTGSGNPGGMNTLREIGWPAGVLAITLDLAKGALAVLLGKALLPEAWGSTAAGVLAVTGHCYSAFLIVSYIRETRSRQEAWLPWWQMQPRLGGKGLAAALGVLLALSWPTMLGALVLFALIALILRYRGLRGSPVVAQATSIVILVSPAMLWFGHRSWPMFLGGIVMAIVTTIKHIPYLELSPNWPRARPNAANPAPVSESVAVAKRGP
jgi:glycerol-3-phosphate acyltransferase PlsY